MRSPRASWSSAIRPPQRSRRTRPSPAARGSQRSPSTVCRRSTNRRVLALHRPPHRQRPPRYGGRYRRRRRRRLFFHFGGDQFHIAGNHSRLRESLPRRRGTGRGNGQLLLQPEAQAVPQGFGCPRWQWTAVNALALPAPAPPEPFLGRVEVQQHGPDGNGRLDPDVSGRRGARPGPGGGRLRPAAHGRRPRAAGFPTVRRCGVVCPRAHTSRGPSSSSAVVRSTRSGAAELFPAWSRSSAGGGQPDPLGRPRDGQRSRRSGAAPGRSANPRQARWGRPSPGYAAARPETWSGRHWRWPAAGRATRQVTPHASRRFRGQTALAEQTVQRFQQTQHRLREGGGGMSVAQGVQCFQVVGPELLAQGGVAGIQLALGRRPVVRDHLDPVVALSGSGRRPPCRSPPGGTAVLQECPVPSATGPRPGAPSEADPLGPARGPDSAGPSASADPTGRGLRLRRRPAQYCRQPVASRPPGPLPVGQLLEQGQGCFQIVACQRVQDRLLPRQRSSGPAKQPRLRCVEV